MRYNAVLSVSLITALALSACEKNEPPTPPKSAEARAPAPAPVVAIVKIGHVGPLTGAIAHMGKDNENGARLAVADANQQGFEIGGKKIQFELVAEDDQADAQTAIAIAQKLVNAKVVGVIGHLNSGTSIPASKIYSNAGIPQISGSATNPQYTHQGFKTTFRVIANDVQQGTVLGNFFVDTLKAKRVAVVDDRTVYGQGLADEVEKAIKAAGATVVAREFTNEKATNFKTMLTKIKAKKPDVIFHGGVETTGAPMLKQMRALGIKAQFAMGDGGCTPQFVRLTGDASYGFVCSHPGLPMESMPSAQAKDFKDRFEKKFGQIQIYAPYTYDATTVLIAAMQKANSTEPAKYLPELAKISYDGITGKIEFDQNGDIKAGFVTIYQAQCGKLDVYSTQSTGGTADATIAVR